MVSYYYVHLYQVIPGHSSLSINGISNMSQMWTGRCVAGIGGAGFCGSGQMGRKKNAERTQADSPSSNWYTIWLFNIAMENGPFIDGLPIINGDFPWLC
jgi:hypothetical protein